MNIRRRNELFPNLFEHFFNDSDRFHANFRTDIPSVNVAEDENLFRIEVAAPGFDREDFDVKVHKDTLTISGEKKQAEDNEKERYTRREFDYKSFKRAFTLPKTSDAEKISANYKDGILYIELPKREEAKPKAPRKIAIA